jgi:hypothetical protein
VVYIENGVAVYNYDIKIATHPIAQFLFSFLVRRKNCKKLIFMSAAGQKSFLATIPYNQKTKAAIEKKSVQIYPLIEQKMLLLKIFSGNLKLLFVGMLYIKGGIELVHAFAKLREHYNHIYLTIISPFTLLKKAIGKMIEKYPG